LVVSFVSAPFLSPKAAAGDEVPESRSEGLPAVWGLLFEMGEGSDVGVVAAVLVRLLGVVKGCCWLLKAAGDGDADDELAAATALLAILKALKGFPKAAPVDDGFTPKFEPIPGLGARGRLEPVLEDVVVGRGSMLGIGGVPPSPSMTLTEGDDTPELALLFL
jgi:hypothetical protein